MNPYLMIFEREMTPIRKLLLMHLAAGGKLTEYTETGNPVSFNTNVAKPLSVLAAFTPVQAGSGDPSPENIRPITGFTGANIYLSPTDADDPEKQTFTVTFPALGKNLFDISTIESGTLDGYGNKVANASRTVTGFITLKAGTYTISRKAATDWWKIWSYTLDEEPLQAIMNKINASHTITLSADSKIRIAFDYIVDAANEVQLESGSPATAYEPYTNTAYGGTIDLTTGVLTVEWKATEIKGTTGLYGGASSYDGTEGTNRMAIITPTGLTERSRTGFADVMKVANAGTWAEPNNYIWKFCVNASDQLHMVFENETVGITSEMSASERTAAIKTWLADNPVTFVLPLATPLVYQLSPVEILSLIGDNVVWSDLNGSLTVIYKKKG